MRLIICAVRDRAADVFGSPYFVPSVGQAVRSFGDEVNRVAEDNVLYKHPDDFDLYELGSYDDAQASFDILPTPRQVALGRDVVRSRDSSTR